ncbi:MULTISPECIES: protein YoaL [unclassified Enterobacter]|uniref:protein YoaL n=2 Tax=Enterobacter TaxID=547 RepID=UPI00093501DE
MFTIRLIIKEYRAVAPCMDRHRRQLTHWPFRASQSGVFRHLSFSSAVITPVLNAPFCHSVNRSLSWNS